ncbi:MAG: hypothetical protein KDK37_10395, partial [Leptospiraceae bacterium]|nr:hypothetical protein [Leptospiraceae bacterium]
TCTFLWSFLLEYSEHLMVAFLSFAGISLFLRTKKSVRNSLLAGAICATALFFRHEVFVFLFAFGLAYLLGGRKNDKNSGATIPHHLQELAAFTTGALIIAVAFAALNGLLYSHPLGPRYLINADGLDVTAGIRAHWAIDLLFWHGIKPGLLGYIPALLPILILGLILAPRLAPEYRTLLLLILIYIPLVLLIVPNNGIMDWGPRYFGPILLPALALARHIWRSDEWASNQRDGRNRWGTILRATLIVLSITPFALNIVGTNYLRKARKQSRQIIQKLEERKADIWVFADLGIFYYSSAEYLHRPILVRGDGNIESLLSLLHQSNAGKKMILVSLSPGIAQDSGASDGSPKGRDTESKNDEVAATIRTNTLTPAESIAVRNWLRSSSEDTIDPGLQLLTGTIP